MALDPTTFSVSPGPINAWSDSGFTEQYRLDRLRVDFSFSDAACRVILHELISPFPLVECEADSGAADLRIVLTRSIPLPPFPQSPSGRTAFGLFIADDGPLTDVRDETAVFRTDPEAGTGELSLGPDFCARQPIHRHNVFLTGLFPLLLGRGYCDLHAAGLIWKGHGLLLVGDAGSGKSTATLALVAAGARYASDDALLLHTEPQGIRAIGFRHKIAIDPVQVERWPELATHWEAPHTDGESKHFVDLDQVYPGCRIPSLRPDVLLFCRIVPEDASRVNAIAPASALVRLLPQSASLAFNRRSVKAQLDTLRALVDQTSSYELHAGRDLLQRPNRLAEVLADLLPGAG